MGNPQHLEWLLEGVEAWNARREREDFDPDFEGEDITRPFVLAEKVDPKGRVSLTGADFARANFRDATIGETLLGRAVFKEADLTGAHLADAILSGTDFSHANLNQANLARVRIFKANFEGTDIRGAKFERVDFTGVNVRLANVSTTFQMTDGSGSETPMYTDLSRTEGLTQEQLEEMIGDTGVILPEGLVHPKDWGPPKKPNLQLPKTQPPKDVSEGDGKLRLVDLGPPGRDDLEAIHGDLREDVMVLRGSGSLDNISRGFDTVFARFAKIVDREFNTLDQTRFGVQTSALRKRLEGQRDEIGAIDAGKLGELDAILMAAELLAARLPEWQEFLAETQGERGAVEAEAAAVDEALEDASAAMEADPEHFDGSLPERLREYWDTKTTEAYLAGVGLLNDAAFVVFRAVRDFTRDTGTESRKIAVKGLAKAVVYGLGSVLAKLAGIIPAELEWVLPWLKYIPTLFG